MVLRIRKSTLSILVIFLLLSTAGIYYLGRPYYLYTFPIISFFTVYIIYLRERHLKMEVSIPKLVGLFFICVFIYSLFLGVSSAAVSISEIWYFQSAVIGVLLRVFLGILVMLLTAFGIGKRVLSYFPFFFSTLLEEILFSIGLGFVFLIYMSFVLGVFKVRYPWFVVLITFFLLTLTYKEILYLVDKLRVVRIGVTGSVFKEKNLVFVTIFFFLVASFSAQLKTVPITWDGLLRYTNTVKVLTFNHGLISQNYSGIASYGLELLLVWFSFLGGFPLVFTSASLWAFLSLLTLFSFSKKFFSEKLGILSMAILVSTPTFLFFAIEENKTDLGLFFFTSLSVYALFNWLINSRKYTWLSLTALLLGVSFTVKYSAAFLIAPVLIIVSFKVLLEKRSIYSQLKRLFLFASFMLIPILPWFFVSPNISLRGYLSLRSDYTPLGSVNNRILDTTSYEQCSEEMKSFDYGVYTPNYSNLRFLQPLMVIYYPTALSYFKFQNPGSLLIPIPLFLGLLYLFKAERIKGNKKTFSLLLVLTSLYFLFWELVRPEIIWYAFPGFFLLALLGSALVGSLSKGIFKKFIVSFVLIGMSIHVIFHAVFHAASMYVPVTETVDTFFSEKLNSLYELSVALNSIKKDNRETKVFSSNLFPAIILPYYIEKSDEWFIPNKTFIFNQEISFEDIAGYLKELGVTHIVTRISSPDDAPFLCMKEHYQRSNSFLKDYGELVFENRDYRVYKLR